MCWVARFLPQPSTLHPKPKNPKPQVCRVARFLPRFITKSSHCSLHTGKLACGETDVACKTAVRRMAPFARARYMALRSVCLHVTKNGMKSNMSSTKNGMKNDVSFTRCMGRNLKNFDPNPEILPNLTKPRILLNPRPSNLNYIEP